jgi:hypothetical protein
MVYEEQEDERDPLYAGPIGLAGARMPLAMRDKLKRLAEAEGRMITPSGMLRLLVKRAAEPQVKRLVKSRVSPKLNLSAKKLSYRKGHKD